MTIIAIMITVVVAILMMAPYVRTPVLILVVVIRSALVLVAIAVVLASGPSVVAVTPLRSIATVPSFRMFVALVRPVLPAVTVFPPVVTIMIAVMVSISVNMTVCVVPIVVLRSEWN